jgi:hypothetical protein
MYSVLQGRSGFEASQSAQAHVLLGAAEGKDLVQGVREALEFSLRIVGRHQVVDDIDQVYRSTVFWTLSPLKFRQRVSRAQPVALDEPAQAFCSHGAQ